LLVSVASAVPAFAATIDNFTISEIATGTTITFSLAANLTPSTVNSSTEFTMNPVQITYDNGAPQTGWISFLDQAPSILDLHIPTQSGFELFEIDSPTYTALFNGPTSSPTFKTGVFTGQDDNNQDPITVTISSAAAPEPSSLALLGTGVLSLAGFVRRKLIPTAA
jgi:hypothetical protein